jgi:hypothetical protein
MLLSACIYDAALDPKPLLPIEPQFIGDWREAESGDRLLIRAFNETEYLLVTANENSIDCYRAFASEVDGVPLANVQYLEPGKEATGKYAFFKYRRETGNLVIQMLNEEILSSELKTTAQLRAAIRENRQNPALFAKETVYVKAKE